MKKGFTLIELLAVIAILAIILLIAFPQILGLLRGTKEKSLESSINLIIRAIESKSSENYIDGNPFPTSGQCSEFSSWDTINGTCTYTVNSNGGSVGSVFVRIVGAGKFDGLIAEGTKDGIQITSGELVESDVIPDESCFTFDSSTNTITGYDLDNPICPKAVIIPMQIGGVDVEILGTGAFQSEQITSLVIQNNVKLLEDDSTFWYVNYNDPYGPN